jgi:hypothetical protein
MKVGVGALAFLGLFVPDRGTLFLIGRFWARGNAMAAAQANLEQIRDPVRMISGTTI